MQNQTNGNGHPNWVKRMLELYQSGVSNAFIVHFNVNDYATPTKPINSVSYLAGIWAKKEIVIIYSRDRGIEFGTDEQRKLAIDMLGLSQQPQAVDPILSALNGIGGGNNTPVQLPNDPAGALPLIDQLLRSDRKVAVIVDGAELIIPATDLATMAPPDRVALATIRRWGRDTAIVNSGNPVFLVTNNISAIHPELRAASSRFEALEVSLPDVDTRKAFIEQWLDDRGSEIDLGELTSQAIANSTAGLSLLHIEDILLRADSRGKLTQDLIWERKESIIRSEYGEVLEVIEPRMDFEDIGGLNHVKDFFTRSVIRPIREGRKNRVPMGVLMTGPAGTGKSIMAEAIATEAKVNAVKLRIGGQIASKWQGEGERNLEKALQAIVGLAPTIVFIDEIDQAMKRGGDSGGSQQDNRIFQRLLEFMADTTHRGQIVFLGATNRPDLIDAALKRPGRFDVSIFFPPPDETDRPDIIKVISRKAFGQAVDVTPEMVKATEGWTGAEIEGAGRKAVEYVEDYDLAPQVAMFKALTVLRPRTKDIEFMSLVALQDASDPDLLPAKYQAMLDNRAELESKIEAGKKAESTYRQKREI